MGNDPNASEPTSEHSAPTSQVPDSAQRSLRKRIFDRIGSAFMDNFFRAYPWIGGLLAVGCVVVGFLESLAFTAAVVTSIGALAVLLGSMLQALAAYVALDTPSNTSSSWLGRFFSGFFYNLAIAYFQWHGWILVLSGSTFLLAGGIMAAIAFA